MRFNWHLLLDRLNKKRKEKKRETALTYKYIFTVCVSVYNMYTTWINMTEFEQNNKTPLSTT